MSVSHFVSLSLSLSPSINWGRRSFPVRRIRWPSPPPCPRRERGSFFFSFYMSFYSFLLWVSSRLLEHPAHAYSITGSNLIDYDRLSWRHSRFSPLFSFYSSSTIYIYIYISDHSQSVEEECSFLYIPPPMRKAELGPPRRRRRHCARLATA